MIAFVARQPIFDRELVPVAHELLFRDGFDNALVMTDAAAATSSVISMSALVFGVEELTGGKKAFINITRDNLLRRHVHLLPADRLVPEMPPDIRPEPAVLEACGRLKRAGYQIALDDVGGDDRGPLLDLADVLIVDFLASKEGQLQSLVKSLRQKKVRMIAKRIEEHKQFAQAMDLGFDYFQGFFFAKPQIVSREQIPANRRHYLELMREVNRRSLSFEEVHDVIKQDVSLTFRLLRYLNSAHFGLPVEVKSIKHALVLLGEREIRKWATLISLACMGEDKPSELLVLALTRARFLEKLAPLVGMSDEAQEMFMMGMMSLLDAIMDRPLRECLKEMPITKRLTDTLLGARGPYRDVLDASVFYERAAWDDLAESARRLRLSESELPQIHLDALRWARQTFGAAASGATAGSQLVT
jgi:EAL and modified HD-GYP domain-containing signal transduction protein